MTKKSSLHIIELIVLYILIPILLTLNIHPIFKIIPVLLGVIYCVSISIKQQLFSLKSLYTLEIKKHSKRILILFLITLLVSTIIMYSFNYENLFIVIRKNWMMWIFITLFYSIFSVYPQEFLYRSFFFKRYQTILKSPMLLIVVNACVFSFAHIVFNNLLVSILTLIGGFLFAFTYYKSKSLLLTSIEHALYGSWLFTLGMGEMLAFPVPN